MTLHQLTHSAGIEFDIRVAETARRLIARMRGTLASWRAARRLEAELSSLDHRELADLTWRR